MQGMTYCWGMIMGYSTGQGEGLEASSLISPYPPAENMHIGLDLEI